MEATPRKEAPILFRTTRARKAIYVEQAAAEGLQLSEWLRRVADRRIEETAATPTPELTAM